MRLLGIIEGGLGDVIHGMGSGDSYVLVQGNM